MNYIAILYLFGLLFFSAHSDKIINKNTFRSAWGWFSVYPLSQFALAFFRAKNYSQPQQLLLVEIWSTGIAGLILCISLNYLLNALIPVEDDE